MWNSVVPHEGTWIEMSFVRSHPGVYRVVPHEGTWIEMLVTQAAVDARKSSFPTRERGLK